MKRLADLSAEDIDAMTPEQLRALISAEPEPPETPPPDLIPVEALKPLPVKPVPPVEPIEVIEPVEPYRKHVRPRTIPLPKYKRHRAVKSKLPDSPLYDDMPATWGECQERFGPSEPCPYVRCRHHLYIEVSPETGSIKRNFPHLELWEIPETCSLRAAHRGGRVLSEVAALVNLTRERTRQIEALGFDKLGPSLEGFFPTDDPQPDIHVDLDNPESDD